ncbi:MAG: DUF1127 domain-containing protein [Dongiaceae bacterium]
MNKYMTVPELNSAAAFSARRLFDAIAGIGGPILQASDRLAGWTPRIAPRHGPSALDNHTLRDIGLLRADIEYAIGKRFRRD